MNAPLVSVVMGVYNGAASLEATLASVLRQQDCDFEFIVVDDGSTDATGRLLDECAARDARLKVIHQANTGLTRALVAGCAAARGEFIARQDCGDLSLPGRIERQAALLRSRSDAVLVGGAVRFTGPAGEPLFVTSRPGEQLEEGLSQLALGRLVGPPHHGATMFRRDAYERAGGYRPFFAVAQDIDLWLRLRELGRCIGETDVAYEARMEAGSISARRRDEQVRMAGIAIECARLRAGGKDDRAFLETQAPAPPVRRRRNEMRERAQFLYFVGSCLRASDPRAARDYFKASLRANPLMLKSLWRLAWTHA
jgi:glycosyltransferase involved in cell wall biosynthesis